MATPKPIKSHDFTKKVAQTVSAAQMKAMALTLRDAAPDDVKGDPKKLADYVTAVMQGIELGTHLAMQGDGLGAMQVALIFHMHGDTGDVAERAAQEIWDDLIAAARPHRNELNQSVALMIAEDEPTKEKSDA